MKPTNLSIIIPAYQEASIIGDTLKTLSEWLESHDYGQTEVIVVVADSPDGTAEIARTMKSNFDNFKVLEPGPRAGKGRDVREGMFAASGQYRLFMDADLATPLTHLDDVHKLMIRQGAVAIAVRDLVSIHTDFKRKMITKIGNLLAQIILLPGLKDTQCGFKVFRADVAEQVFGRMTILGWGFDLEILAVARKLGYAIDTFEAPDWHDPKEHGSGLVGDSAIHAAIRTFSDLWRVRWNLLCRRYRKPSYPKNPSA